MIAQTLAPLLRNPEKAEEDTWALHTVKGRDAILRLTSQLIEFSVRCGQTGAMQDIAYFLSKPGALPRMPHLLLVSRTADLDTSHPNLDDLVGLLLIFEFRRFGIGTGAFATNDRSGRSNLIALPEHRSRVAALTSRALLNRGAHLILMSFRTENPLDENNSMAGHLQESTHHRKPVANWAQRERTIPGYLPLETTVDATLAAIGQRTRSNLRYYRRRAETRLGCTFIPEIKVSRAEVLTFNRHCMYAVADDVAGWRYDSLRNLSDPLLMGIKDNEGRWLSMLGARRYNNRSEILWQMNRDGFAADSLSTVMRSYFIENEITHGSRRMYIEGGTPHPIRFSFVPEMLTDLAVVRRTSRARAMRMAAQRYISTDNELSQMLDAKNVDWLPC